ncbi:unnamed protein product [Urochloa humidicola]
MLLRIACGRQSCENCGLNNHSTYDCKREPPWNYGPELCATQVEDQSFFYIEERIDHRASRDKASTAIITVSEGVATARDIEAEFRNTVDSSVWRWAARKIADNKFTMRFPDTKMVQVYSSFKSLGLRATNAQIVVEPWNSAIGAKGELQQAWIRVKGIPVDQRSIKTVAKVGGLVGKTMMIDEKTRLKSDYVRMRIACRDATKVPTSVEGTLGLKIYDFFFEREVLDEMPEDGAKIGVQADAPSGQPNPKRVRLTGESGQKDGSESGHIPQRGSDCGTPKNQKSYQHHPTSAPGKLDGELVNMASKDKSTSASELPIFSSGDSEETDDSEDFNDKLARINAQYTEGGSSQTDQLWFMQCSDTTNIAKSRQELLLKKQKALIKAGLAPESDDKHIDGNSEDKGNKAYQMPDVDMTNKTADEVQPSMKVMESAIKDISSTKNAGQEADESDVAYEMEIVNGKQVSVNAPSLVDMTAIEVEGKGQTEMNEREERRRSERLQQKTARDTQMKNEAMAKKRNIEGLFKTDHQAQVAEGIGILLSIACRMLATDRRAVPRLLLPAGGSTSFNLTALESEEDDDETRES